MSKYEITVDGKNYVVEIGDISTFPAEVIVNGERKMVEVKEGETSGIGFPPAVSAPSAPSAPEPESEPKPAPAVVPAGVAEGQRVIAPMPGKILSIRVKVGEAVLEGDTVCTLEAMKMEMPISSTASGTVQIVHAQVGDNVAYNDPLVTIG